MGYCISIDTISSGGLLASSSSTDPIYRDLGVDVERKNNFLNFPIGFCVLSFWPVKVQKSRVSIVSVSLSRSCLNCQRIFRIGVSGISSVPSQTNSMACEPSINVIFPLSLVFSLKRLTLL